LYYLIIFESFCFLYFTYRLAYIVFTLFDNCIEIWIWRWS